MRVSTGASLGLPAMEIRLTDANYADPVADDLVLWRYLDFPKFLDLLTSDVLKMPRASKMEDGF